MGADEIVDELFLEVAGRAFCSETDRAMAYGAHSNGIGYDSKAARVPAWLQSHHSSGSSAQTSLRREGSFAEHHLVETELAQFAIRWWSCNDHRPLFDRKPSECFNVTDVGDDQENSRAMP